MIVKALAENTSVSSELGSEHGLSLFIETRNHKLLFDTGAGDLFAKNARLMGVDIKSVDTAFLSHGHHDHGGGLAAFLALNNSAKVCLSGRAFEGHFANFKDGSRKDVGIDASLLPNGRFVFVGDGLRIDGELELFSDVHCLRLNPSGNADLLKQDGDAFVRDDFAHEQNLVIRENGGTVLVTGCSHCGIVNILEHFYTMNGAWPDAVIGGFHLYNPARGEYEDPGIVREIACFLLTTGARFYTCHCTGMESYKILKASMGDSVDYLSGGMALTL
jgi:7,8-dihydropterin-6-yl-methyl-4-(beta-D-ribofuranosyl)aminobenzene 5'-phosphate synthase